MIDSSAIKDVSEGHEWSLQLHRNWGSSQSNYYEEENEDSANKPDDQIFKWAMHENDQ